MSLNNLLAKTEKFMVNDSKGFGELVVYERDSIAREGFPVRAMVSKEDLRKGTSKEVHDETIFYSMDLGEKPRENAEIVFYDESFIVKSWRLGSGGLWDVVTLSHKALKHRRERR